jgi:hypothetical protein
VSVCWNNHAPLKIFGWCTLDQDRCGVGCFPSGEDEYKARAVAQKAREMTGQILAESFLRTVALVRIWAVNASGHMQRLQAIF